MKDDRLLLYSNVKGSENMWISKREFINGIVYSGEEEIFKKIMDGWGDDEICIRLEESGWESWGE